MELQEYQTVFEPSEAEEVIKKSRFIARAYPVSSEDEIKEIIKQARKEFYKATHVCSAWILATEPEQKKASDDGEPSGTAGKPILNVLEQKDLKNVLVLVVRYFGGIKLGASGLIRAYSGATSKVLDKADLAVVHDVDIIEVQVEYGTYQSLNKKLRDQGIVPVEENFEDLVRMRFFIPIEKTDSFKRYIINETNDSCLIEVIETKKIKEKKRREDVRTQ